MIYDHLLDELDKVASRIRQLQFWRLLAAAWIVAALVAAGLCLAKATIGLPTSLAAPLAVLLAAVLASVGAWLAMRAARDPRAVARRVESEFPELRTCLLAAVEQRPDLPGGRYGYLQSSVIRQALTHAQRHHWAEIVSPQSIVWAALANCVAMLVFAVALAAVVFTVARPVADAAAALANSGLGTLGSGFAVTVEPGDTEVERGTSVMVLARVTGRMPAEASLVIKPASGELTQLPMNAGLEDPVFGARIPLIDQPLEYHVELGGQSSPVYKIGVFEYPRLERADAKLVYPAYTGLEPRLIQDVRTVSAIEGTELTIICRLNKPVVSAVLSETRNDSGHEPLVLSAASPSEPAVVQATLTMTQSRRLALRLVDDAGRQNTQEAQFSLHVLPNQPPSLKPTFPARDLEVSALEEIDVKATVFDDIGLVRHGISYSLAGQEPVEAVLGERAAAKQKHELAHRIRLEELKAEPDQLLSYYWWAEDHAADGQVRRTESDMYFAEVRPFEEIFRQGQQPPGGEQQQRQQQQQGQSQNAQDAQQLAQLQKEIINATWKLIRREIGSKLTDAFASDVEQVQLSQAAAIEQAGALAQRLTDEQSQGHIEAVVTHMGSAADHLQAAHDGPGAAPLKAALPAEQAALAALLKLRAREHEVVRQQQRQRGSQSQRSQSRSRQQQQQLNELELSNEQNRYETQRTAQEQEEESAADRENRQVLNRLRELARRQHDLNERLKELQSALEEARTQEQKEEIRRQLKRLQDEQRQILQDTDELQSRLDQPENAERMAEERQQLDETRDNVRRASEALEQEQVTRAAASGTRAEQQFEDLREEFRRRAANRFSEEVQQLRDAAQQLDEREQDLSQRLREASGEQTGQEQEQSAQQQSPRESKGKSQEGTKSKTRPKTKSLQSGNQREQIADDLNQQRERLSQLQNQMRDTLMEAEETEPLLSQRLYDAARGVQERQLDERLRAAERSVRQGLAQDAQEQERAAGEGISQLREGIEEAAEAVLGDETEALRQARERLEDLSRELDQEIGRNDPSRQGSQQQESQQPGQQQRGQQQDGRQQGQQPQDRQPGQQQDGQQQGNQQPGEPGQQQRGQQQPGEQQQGEQQGQQQSGQRQSDQQQSGQQQRGQRRLGDPQNEDRPDANRRGGATGGADERRFTPLSGGGEEFRDWSDRLRDVEEMVQDPELRAEAARIRERARALRAEFKRHSDKPNWELVQQQVAGPLFELRDRVVEELLRRTAKKAIVPLDRDPVPPEYAEKTRRYYEQLGGGR
jgi:hypothetical protein